MADDLADIRESRTTNELLRQILAELRGIREKLEPPVPKDPSPLPYYPMPVWPVWPQWTYTSTGDKSVPQ